MTKIFEKIAEKNEINNESKKNLFRNCSSLFFGIGFIVFNKSIVAAFATFIVEENMFTETNLDTLVSDWRRFVNYINIYKKIQFRWEKRLIPVDFEEYCHI